MPAIAVGAEGMPVNVGEAIGAFVMSAVKFVVILAVFEATFVFRVMMSEMFDVMLAVFVDTMFVNEVRSAVFAFNAKPGTVGAAAVPLKSPVS